jgi:phenylacetate-CoA ligase
MLRPFLLKASAYTKTDGIVDRFIRYNPIIRRRLLPIILQNKDASVEAESTLQNDLTERTLSAAQATRYGAGRGTKLAAWPLLEKDTLRESAKDFISPSALLRLPAATGGTTGIPLRLWRSLEQVVAEQIFLDELLGRYGHDMRRSRLAVLRGDRVEGPAWIAARASSVADFPYGRLTHNGKRLTLSSPHLNRQTLPWFYETLQRFAPSILWVYPNMALNLLNLMQDTRRKLEIPIILSSSETMSASLHRALAGFFNSKIINYYGQAERVCFAYSTEPGVFYFNPRYGRVELREPRLPDASGRNLEIIGTGYWNLAMPLVRYRTGDLIRVPSNYAAQELEEVAAGKRPFPEILGRDQEYILTREGIRITGLNQVPKEVQNVFQIQIIQLDLDTVIIKLIPMPGYSENDAKKIMENARLKIPASINIRIETAAKLQVTKRGKAPYVLRAFEKD